MKNGVENCIIVTSRDQLNLSEYAIIWLSILFDRGADQLYFDTYSIAFHSDY